MLKKKLKHQKQRKNQVFHQERKLQNNQRFQNQLEKLQKRKQQLKEEKNEN